MPVYHGLTRLRLPAAVTIGNFDGFHLGHRRVVKALAQVAHKRGYRSTLLTFFPHPRLYFRHPLHLIFSDRQKREVLRRQGVDRLYFLDFARFQGMDASSFVARALVDTLKMKVLVFSGDFLFGSGREGNVPLLRDLASRLGFDIVEVPPVEVDGERVSSSAIRKKLERGEVAGASRMLGEPYAILGRVERGEGRGRRLGFPTLNIASENTLLPPGVFHTQVEVGQDRFQSVTNIGLRPTFGADANPRVETHIPGFRGQLYGRRVRLLFLDKIRNEVRFDSEEQLREQIAADIARALK